MVYQYFYGIPVFLRYVGLLVYNFLLNIDTGMTKIPSFRFFCCISPSSSLTMGITGSLCILDIGKT